MNTGNKSANFVKLPQRIYLGARTRPHCEASQNFNKFFGYSRHKNVENLILILPTPLPISPTPDKNLLDRIKSDCWG
jgi:hypothetical protein